MGSIAKTTIIRQINNRLQKEIDKFNFVIWITVSQPLDVIKLQHENASALNQSFPATEDKERHKVKLFEMLQAKTRFVLILDNI